MEDLLGLDPALAVFILLAGLFAGWVDAVVGGGGLVQLPAVLMIPGLSPVQALAVNKLGSVFGTAASALTYYRRTRLDLRLALPMAALALTASFSGAFVATLIPASAFKPVILLALVAVLLFTLFKPSLGQRQSKNLARGRQMVLALALGMVIGFYDGALGPGTGSFLVIGMVSLLGFTFLEASAHAKVINLATNLGALIFFVFSGYQVWLLGLMLGAANLLGGYLGARTAISRGSGFIRYVLVIVVLALIFKLGYDLLTAA